MKRLSLFISTITFALSLHAQTGKGWREVGGAGSLVLDFKNTNYTFSLTPETYWFTGDHFALGTDFGFGFNSSKQNDSNSTSMTFGYITPGMRYFFGTSDKNKWRPYLFGNGGYQFEAVHMKVDNVKSNSTNNGFRGYAGLGLAWFFSDHAAFDIRFHAIDFAPSTDASGNTTVKAEFTPSFFIGVQAFFHHD